MTKQFEVTWPAESRPCVISGAWERLGNGVIVGRYSREELVLCTDIAKTLGKSGEDMYQGSVLGVRATAWIVELPARTLLLVWHMNATIKEVVEYLAAKYEKFAVFPILAGEFVVEEVTMQMLCPNDRRGINEVGQVVIDTDVHTPEQASQGDVLLSQAGLIEEAEAW